LGIQPLSLLLVGPATKGLMVEARTGMGAKTGRFKGYAGVGALGRGRICSAAANNREVVAAEV